MTAPQSKIRKCSKCHYTAPVRIMVMIMERQKGILTGRFWLLCPECRKGYLDKEIHNLPMSLDDKIRLTQWNQKESNLFS